MYVYGQIVHSFTQVVPLERCGSAKEFPFLVKIIIQILNKTVNVEQLEFNSLQIQCGPSHVAE